MKNLITVFALIAITLFGCDKQASKQLAPTEESSKASPSKGKKSEVVTTLGTTATVTLTNNGGGSFSIDYGGATDVVTHYFRGGDSLSVSGNVYPTASLQYAPIFTTWTSTFTTTYYQCVVVTGSTQRDANGILGADWVFNYSNVVQ